MPVRPSVRFDVFKRDEFTCQYCGRRVPDVTLEVDHIIAIAEGGGDEFENLLTSCFECNRGKGATPLDTKAAVEDMTERTELLKEREKQLRAYHNEKEKIRERQNEQLRTVWDYWFEIWGETELPRYYIPTESSLRFYIDRIGPSEIVEAMDTARAKFRWINTNPVKYAMGICKWRLAEHENRVVPCTICGKKLMLDKGDDRDAGWYHTACKKDGDG